MEDEQAVRSTSEGRWRTLSWLAVLWIVLIYVIYYVSWLNCFLGAGYLQRYLGLLLNQ